MDTDFLSISLAECLRAVRLTARPADQLAGNGPNTPGVPAIGSGRRTPSHPVLTVPKAYLSGSPAQVTRADPQTPDPLVEDPGGLPRLHGDPLWAGEPVIRKHLARAEHLIRRELPAQALQLLQAPGFPPSNWPLRWHPCWYLLVGWALVRNKEPDRARSALEQGLEVRKDLLARRPGDENAPFLREVGAWLCYFQGVSFDQSDQPAQALTCYQRALIATAHDAVHDPELKMLVFQGLGNAYLAREDSRLALAFLAMAQKHGLDACNARAQGSTEWGLGLACWEQGDLPQAKRMLSQASQRFDQLNMLPLVAQVRSSLGLVLMELQHDDEAEHLLRQGLGLALRCGDPYTRGGALGNLAVLQVARGKFEKAIHTVEEGLETIQQTRSHHLAGDLYLILARAYEAIQQNAAAETAITMAIRHLHQTRQPGFIVRAHERYGQFLANQGRFQEAYEQLQLPAFAPTGV